MVTRRDTGDDEVMTSTPVSRPPQAKARGSGTQPAGVELCHGVGPRHSVTSQSAGNTQPRRVFLVEDHPLTRRGLETLVNYEPDLRVCGEAEDVEEAFDRISSLRPDVVIVDLTLRQSSGLDLIPRLRAACPWVRTLVVSMHDEPRWIELALSAGAHGYLTKDESAAQLIHGIREILEGRRFLSKHA